VEVRGETGRAEYGARVSSVDSLVFVEVKLSYIGGSWVGLVGGSFGHNQNGRTSKTKTPYIYLWYL